MEEELEILQPENLMDNHSLFVKGAHFILNWVFGLLNAQGASGPVKTLIMVVVAAICSIVVYWIFKLVLFQIVLPIVRWTETKVDDILLNKKVLNRLALVACVIPLIAFGRAVGAHNMLHMVYMKFAYVYLVVVLGLLVREFIAALFQLSGKAESLGGLRQIIAYAICIIMGVIILAVLFDKNPVKLVAGLGASAAIVSLVFKDTIQSLVAGIQLLANDMLSIGDWIAVPKANANGKVIAIHLNTIKIRNWDNTVTTVPPSTLLSDSFTSWQDMLEGAGRRISRSLCIDMASVRFMEEAEIATYRKFPELNVFFEYRPQQETTNLTLFRHYMYQYLLNDSQIQLAYRPGDEDATDEKIKGDESKKTNPTALIIDDDDDGKSAAEKQQKEKRKTETKMRVMVRYLQPSQYGLPVELYCFTKDKEWEAHEDVIAELTEHMLGVMQRFDLRPYQVVNGNVEKAAQPRTGVAQTGFQSM